MIYNIQRYSTHDGDGIRTMIFYKGCPLRCRWCSNPESHEFGFSIMYDRRLCRNFGDCLKAEPEGIRLTDDGIVIDRPHIDNPGKLTGVCASGALKIIGEKKNTGDILKEIARDLPFYGRSNGGVTLSGGEPLSAGEELTELLKELKNMNIDVAIETSLHVSWDMAARTIGLVSTYLADIKHTDGKIFREYTGGDISLVNSNLEKLAATGEHIIIRIPVVPGFNHSLKDIKAIIDYTASIQHIEEVHFIPYHNLGAGKYEMAGMEYPFSRIMSIHPSELKEYVQYAQEKGFNVKTGG